MAENKSDELMVLAAWMFGDDGLTHQEIASKLHLSRVAVTRLLQRARREGILQIKITKPLPLQYELERRLQKTFALKSAIVVKTRGSLDETLDEIGRAGAGHLDQILFPKCRLGVGWSRTVSRMAPYLVKPAKPVNCVVNDLAGSVLDPQHPYSISWHIAQVLAAKVEALPAPVVVNSAEARQALLNEPAISTAMEHARQCDIAIVGLGDLEPDCTLVRTGFMSSAQRTDLQAHGAVGDILMRFFDASGRYVSSPLDPRVISLTRPEIERIPYVVVLGAGPTKIDAIVGALRGRLCHGIILDTDTAEQVLERAERSQG
ncbi:MAG: sugar-binding transcriptional regulator [Chloroflexi bacterium]|nr:sugar-binding transcriptional regulator [Chloroflexota bacterium]